MAIGEFAFHNNLYNISEESAPKIGEVVYFGKYEVSYYEYFVFINDLRNSGYNELYEKYKTIYHMIK
jgi:hypothetical protein